MNAKPKNPVIKMRNDPCGRTLFKCGPVEFMRNGGSAYILAWRDSMLCYGWKFHNRSGRPCYVLGLNGPNSQPMHTVCFAEPKHVYWLRRQIRFYVPRWLQMANPFPVYYVEDSRDCDHVRVVSAHKANNGYRYVKACDLAYEHSEGPTSLWKVTQTEYKNHITSERDYVLEAVENGHPHSVGY